VRHYCFANLLINCICFALSPVATFTPSECLAQEKKAATKPIHREVRKVVGWSVHINGDLLKTEPAATQKALELLAAQLQQIDEELPAPAVAQLKKVKLYFSPAYPKTQARAEFHPGEQWLKENGRDPVMVRSVEFTNIPEFEAETIRMPNFALHELAHAYHFLNLKDGYGNADVIKAFEVAKASGKYARVERSNGIHGKNTFEKAYAISSPMEYFAEATEAYFSRNDYFPYTAKELQMHDPEMFSLLTKLWGVSSKRR
jgi:hypothetical protein